MESPPSKWLTNVGSRLVLSAAQPWPLVLLHSLLELALWRELVSEWASRDRKVWVRSQQCPPPCNLLVQIQGDFKAVFKTSSEFENGQEYRYTYQLWDCEKQWIMEPGWEKWWKYKPKLPGKEAGCKKRALSQEAGYVEASGEAEVKTEKARPRLGRAHGSRRPCQWLD